MNKNNKDHDRLYQKLKYEVETGKRESMIENIYEIAFTGDVKATQLKRAYKDHITTDEERLLLSNALVLADLIRASKTCLETEGVYIRTATGLIKENPAQKALRDNIKAFTVLLDTLNKTIKANKQGDKIDLDKWLDD